MKPLCLNPFPTRRADDGSAMHLIEREGFVDEAVVTALVRESHLGRSIAYPDDLALAADDLDFAGWSLPKTLPTRSAEVPPRVIDAIVRRATFPQATRELRRHSRRPWLIGFALLLIAAVIVVFAAHAVPQRVMIDAEGTATQPFSACRALVSF